MCLVMTGWATLLAHTAAGASPFSMRHGDGITQVGVDSFQFGAK